MSSPSHITAPLIGCVTTCSAVLAMSSLIAPLLDGPTPKGQSLPSASSAATLSPALREAAPLTSPSLAGATVRLPGTGTAASAPGVFALGAPTTSSTTSVSADPSAPEPDPTSGGQSSDRAQIVSTTVAGGERATASLPGRPTTPGPAPSATTVATLPDNVLPPAGDTPKRFILRVLDVAKDDNDQILVRVAVAPGAGEPEGAMTIALKPSSIGYTDGQAVKVSLDIVSGATAADDPQLRVRVTVVDDTTGGVATAVDAGQGLASNVLDVTLPLPEATDSEGGEATPAPKPDAGELLLSLEPTIVSTGSASTAPTAPDTPSEGSVTVEISVVADPSTIPVEAPATIAPEPTAPVTETAPNAAPAPETTARSTPEPVTLGIAPTETEESTPPPPAAPRSDSTAELAVTDQTAPVPAPEPAPSAPDAVAPTAPVPPEATTAEPTPAEPAVSIPDPAVSGVAGQDSKPLDPAPAVDSQPSLPQSADVPAVA